MSFRAFAIAAAFAFPAGAAHAAAITGGTTSVELTSASTLAGLGVSVSGLGSATIEPTSPPTALFPITGGTISPTGDLIQHNGSGLQLAAGATTVDASNFLIDTANAFIDADVSVDGGTSATLALFKLGTGATPTTDIPLTLTSAAASALDSAFKTSALTTSVQIGLASTAPTVGVIPEPATMGLLGLGLAATLGLRRRFR